MNYSLFLAISLIVYLVIIVFALWLSDHRQKKYKKALLEKEDDSVQGVSEAVFSVLNWSNLLLLATGLSAYLLVLPFHIEETSVFESLLISVQHMLQVFSLDADYSIIHETLTGEPILRVSYLTLASWLHATAPVLTITTVLSFFKGINNYFSLLSNKSKPLYVFSELNDRSITLAKSCLAHDLNEGIDSFCVFANTDSNTDSMEMLIAEAQKFGALCIPASITTADLMHSASAPITLFAINDDEDETIVLSLSLAKKYSHTPKSTLYIFASSQESELILGSVISDNKHTDSEKSRKLVIRRINAAERIMNHHFYKDSVIFKALPDEGPEGSGKPRLVPSVTVDEDGTLNYTLVIVGFGEYGKIFLKSILNTVQYPGNSTEEHPGYSLHLFPGFRLHIHVFDTNEKAESYFRSECPELMAHSGHVIDGETPYTIKFYDMVDDMEMPAFSRDFEKHFSAIPHVNHVFVALQEDRTNIELIGKIRTMILRQSQYNSSNEPILETVIQSSKVANAAKTYNLAPFKGTPFSIRVVGDFESIYQYDVIINSDLDADAEARHLLWADKERLATEAGKQEVLNELYGVEYNYRSSIASAIRKRFRIDIRMPGVDIPPASRDNSDTWTIRRAEHSGWNAWMRTMGFSFNETRNDAAKQHHLLIPFDKLPLEHQEKDDD